MFYLWLLPHPDVYESLAQLIIQLGHEHDGPSFEPHITLLGNIEDDEKTAISKTTELANIISRFKVNVDVIEGQNKYYQSLYLKLIRSEALLDARQQAERVFNQASFNPATNNYMPHISLLYGDQPEAIKPQIITTLSGRIPGEYLIDRLTLVFSQGGPPDTWKTITTQPLQ